MKRTDNLFKRMIASVLACTLIFGLCSCDEEDWSDDQTEESVPDESPSGLSAGFMDCCEVKWNWSTSAPTLIRSRILWTECRQTATPTELQAIKLTKPGNRCTDRSLTC